LIYTVTLNPAIDYVMHPVSLDMGFTNRSSSEEVYCGGNGINISTLLNELKVVNVAFGIAAGFTGDYLIKTLQDNGVSANFVRLKEGFTRINVKLNGIVMTMCNGMGPVITPDKVDELLERLECIAQGDTLILTGSIPKSLPEDMYDIIMKRLENRGVRFVVDAPGALLLKSLPAHPFLIKPKSSLWPAHMNDIEQYQFIKNKLLYYLFAISASSSALMRSIVARFAIPLLAAVAVPHADAKRNASS
jgi:1-phosphofructokinase